MTCHHTTLPSSLHWVHTSVYSVIKELLWFENDSSGWVEGCSLKLSHVSLFLQGCRANRLPNLKHICNILKKQQSTGGGGWVGARTWVGVFTFPADRNIMSIDQVTIKTSNPKCRLYWCLIGFKDWEYSKSCWYFRPLLWTRAPLTFSLVHPPPPFPVWISTGVCIYPLCNRGEGASDY